MIEVKQRYGLIGVVGDREDGKTTWAVRHVKREMALKTNYNKAFANLHYKESPEVDYINYAGIRCLDEPTEEGKPTILIHVDQIHKYCDARRSGSKENVEFCESLIESRQHGYDMVYTTWAMSSIDPRLRKFTKLWVHCSKKQDGFHYDYYDVDSSQFITPPAGLVMSYQAAQTYWQFFRTGELVRDDTLSKIAKVSKEKREDLAMQLAIYEEAKPLSPKARQ